ncbi:hypothetical protein LAD77_00020 [Klebsiella pneumoniae]|nr:hypothetical protein [Klebsiella pneumoniae]
MIFRAAHGRIFTEVWHCTPGGPLQPGRIVDAALCAARNALALGVERRALLVSSFFASRDLLGRSPELARRIISGG